MKTLKFLSFVTIALSIFAIGCYLIDKEWQTAMWAKNTLFWAFMFLILSK